jgi:hypothetical protein
VLVPLDLVHYLHHVPLAGKLDLLLLVEAVALEESQKLLLLLERVFVEEVREFIVNDLHEFVLDRFQPHLRLSELVSDNALQLSHLLAEVLGNLLGVLTTHHVFGTDYVLTASVEKQEDELSMEPDFAGEEVLALDRLNELVVDVFRNAAFEVLSVEQVDVQVPVQLLL